MYLQFEKFTTGQPSGDSAIIVDLDKILLFAADLQGTTPVTRVEVICNPKFTFYTPSTMATISSIIGNVDATGGAASSGSSCMGTAGLLDTVSIASIDPFISVTTINNNISTNTGIVTFNPNFLVYSEVIPYTDLGTQKQASALLIVLDDVQAKKIMTTLAFQDLATLLGPTLVS